MKKDIILILDYGSQYTQLISRRIRELGAYNEIHSWDLAKKALSIINKNKNFTLKGIILSGGPASVNTKCAPSIAEEVFVAGVPILGICYGMQAIVEHFGGKVATAAIHEYGKTNIRIMGHSNLLKDIEDYKTKGYSMLKVWMSHGDNVTQLPNGFKLIASNKDCPIAGIYNERKKIYAVQFHLEVTHTNKGAVILERFIKIICQVQSNWSVKNITKELIERIQKQVGQAKKKKVILGLSGGVDSSVAAVLINKAIGKNLICIFIDNGLLRLNEAAEVVKNFNEKIGINLIRINAKNEFLQALQNIEDSEQKRKIIGNKFVEIFEREAEKIKNIGFLAQGTIYPDVIESAGRHSDSKHAKTIKSHHNVGGLPENMKLELLEPLKFLFKDEVRHLGLELGLTSELINRHPFPGPGLGVRILGEIKKEYIKLLRKADAIFIAELRNAGLYDSCQQAFVVFMPIKSVGITGDYRRYGYVVSIRAVETIDFMTAKFVNFHYEFLELVSSRILNEIPEIARVVYDISSKPPATIEWE